MKLSKIFRGALASILLSVFSVVGLVSIAGATPPTGWVNNGSTGYYKVTTLTESACQGDHGAWTEGPKTDNCVIGISYGISPCPAGWTDNGSTGCYAHLTFPSAAVCQYNGGVWIGGKVGNCLRGLSYNTRAPAIKKTKQGEKWA